jgi:hypothetical protein
MVVTEPVAPAEVAPAPVANPVEGRKIDLSPLAAALTMRDSFESLGRCKVALADGSCGGAGTGDAEVVAKRAPSEHDRLIALRKELKLEPQGDGSYRYNGVSLRATVLPDGRVEFEDKIHDLNSLAERLAGSQLNPSEKRHFMQSTAELRDQLASAAEAKNQERGKHGLRIALERVWSDRALSLVQKRAAMFTLWDDCASDASGSAAQASIESFVRAHLPEGTPLAYSRQELAQLNRARVSRRSFDPYAAYDAGAQPG